VFVNNDVPGGIPPNIHALHDAIYAESLREFLVDRYLDISTLYKLGDWETHVMFWRWRDRYGEADALARMASVFNDDYPQRGMVFALGNQAKRPQTWQLLGVIRLDEMTQGDLFG